MLQIIFKALNFLVQDSPGGSGAQGDLSISNGFKSVTISMISSCVMLGLSKVQQSLPVRQR